MMEELVLIKEYHIDKKNEYDWFEERLRIEKIYNHINLKNILENYREQFEKNNIKYIVGEFAGGHDEGGFDKIYFSNKPEGESIVYKFNNSWITMNKLFYVRNKHDVIFYKMCEHKSIDLNDISELDSLLFKTGCLDRFGSFAFEGHCSGKVNLDVINGKWTMSGEETFETYESFDEEGEVA